MEFEFVVEFADCDEGREALACFFGGCFEFFRGEARSGEAKYRGTARAGLALWGLPQRFSMCEVIMSRS